MYAKLILGTAAAVVLAASLSACGGGESDTSATLGALQQREQAAAQRAHANNLQRLKAVQGERGYTAPAK